MCAAHFLGAGDFIQRESLPLRTLLKLCLRPRVGAPRYSDHIELAVVSTNPPEGHVPLKTHQHLALSHINLCYQRASIILKHPLTIKE
jgi:hypothetical protein